MRFAFVCLFITLLTQVCQKTWAVNDAEMKMVMKECQAKHDIDEFQHSDLSKEPSEVDMNIKCYMHCLVKSMQFLDEDGKLDDGKFLESNIMPSAQSDLISDCKARHDMTEDPCEYAFDLFHCINA